MSNTDTTITRATERAVHQIIKGTAGLMSGKPRGRSPVRRHSYDVDDRRAQRFRRIGDGTVAGALSWIDCLLKVVSEWDDLERRKQGARPLGLHGLRVLETLLGRRGKVVIDFRSGRIDPAIDTIAAAARVARTTVVRALAQLKAMGVLDWVRRTMPAGNKGSAGPQHHQVSNGYWMTPEMLPATVYRRLRDLVARRALARSTAKPEPEKPRGPTDPALRAALDGLARTMGASPPSDQHHRSGVEG